MQFVTCKRQMYYFMWSVYFHFVSIDMKILLQLFPKVSFETYERPSTIPSEPKLAFEAVVLLAQCH